MIKLENIKLEKGDHDSREEGVCAMEAVAWLAGEDHSDMPKCVCPAIRSFVISWNDGMGDNDRNRILKPLLPKLIGTAGSRALAERRGLMALDWLIRVQTPAWLELTADLKHHAEALRSLPEIVDLTTAEQAAPVVRKAEEAARKAGDAAGDAARNAAWNAAGNAAGDAARNAAGNAAGNAAWNAAGNAAGNAAWDAAWNAARNAAWDAAWNAAWDAAWDALRPTVERLQQSAVELLERMIAATDQPTT